MGDQQGREDLEKRIAEIERMTCDDPVKFREVFQSVNEFIFEHDGLGNFTGICPRLIGFLGYGREELISRNVRDLLLDRDRQHVQGYLERVRKNGRDEGLIQILNKLGRRRIVEYKNFWVDNPDGAGVIRGIAKDVTDVLETEQALIESEIRFRTILDSIEDGYFEVDLHGNFTFFNDAIPNHIGYSPDELLGMSYTEYMDEANRRLAYETFHNVFMTGSPTKSFEWQIIKKDGTRIFVDASVSLQRNRNGEPTGFCGIIRDISDRKRSEQELAYLAYHDALTGLHNRKAFMEKLDEVIREARRHGSGLSIFYIDLDHFKRVNDVHGHEIGDGLLVQVASRLRSALRDTDYISRLGGDEFTVIVNGHTRSNPARLADRILRELGRPYHVNKTRIDFVTPSIGISTYPDDGLDAGTLLKHADDAMYKAKQTRNSFQVFDGGRKGSRTVSMKRAR